MRHEDTKHPSVECLLISHIPSGDDTEEGGHHVSCDRLGSMCIVYLYAFHTVMLCTVVYPLFLAQAYRYPHISQLPGHYHVIRGQPPLGVIQVICLMLREVWVNDNRFLAKYGKH